MMFSVVVAVKNEVQHIKECANSLFKQDYQGTYDITIVDGIDSEEIYSGSFEF